MNVRHPYLGVGLLDISEIEKYIWEKQIFGGFKFEVALQYMPQSDRLARVFELVNMGVDGSFLLS